MNTSPASKREDRSAREERTAWDKRSARQDLSPQNGFSDQESSPGWGSTTKLVVGLTFVAIVAALLIRFRFILGPLILAFMLAYLLNPLAASLSKIMRISWRTSVAAIYIFLAIVLAGLITVLGLVIIQQIQSLYGVILRFVNELPTLVEEIPLFYQFGPFVLDLSEYPLESLVNELLPNLQTPLSRVGSVISSFASGTLGLLGWGIFTLIVSYFLLAGTNLVSHAIVPVDIPGYNDDLRKMGARLRITWNAFLRGQVTVIVIVVIVYAILYLAMGVRFSFALAVLVGLARLVPYLGPITTYIVIFLVIFFQPGNYFGLEQWAFAVLVIVISFVVDQFFDQVVSPRILGETLGVHPAALLVVAIMAANLLGIVGLVLAAPVLATLQLVGRYITRKMLDLDPFPPEEDTHPRYEIRWQRLGALWRLLRMKVKNFRKPLM
jgi:predicted PurR-regulated permease PerM